MNRCMSWRDAFHRGDIGGIGAIVIEAPGRDRGPVIIDPDKRSRRAVDGQRAHPRQVYR
jgi:hypothetical protein